jgi:hypothetical protein
MKQEKKRGEKRKSEETIIVEELMSSLYAVVLYICVCWSDRLLNFTWSSLNLFVSCTASDK